MLVAKIAFWGTYGAILLSPCCLLLLGSRVAKRRIAAEREEVEAEELLLARRLAWIAACAPMAQVLLNELPTRSLGNLSVYLWIGAPLICVCVAIVAVILFLGYAKGLERFGGPAASIFAAIVAVISSLAGTVAA
jgi:hypothetical protein